ncbi:MAG: phosphohydrolase [Desulfurococcaceae archaeon]
MVVINPNTLLNMISGNDFLNKAYKILAKDAEVQTLWVMSNIMAVNRLRYNDHGPVHAHIAAGASLYLYQLLLSRNIQPTLIKNGVVDNVEYTWLVPLYGALLHDIGNSVHRDMHEKIGVFLAKPILDRVLRKLIPDPFARVKVRQEILHAIYCTSYEVECLTIEAGCVKVGDGLDMAEGRARIPYKLGEISIHSVSALSIRSVEIVPGDNCPIRVNVYMNERAGVFQIDEILIPKINTTMLRDYIEVYAIIGDNILKTYSPRK